MYQIKYSLFVMFVTSVCMQFWVRYKYKTFCMEDRTYNRFLPCWQNQTNIIQYPGNDFYICCSYMFISRYTLAHSSSDMYFMMFSDSIQNRNNRKDIKKLTTVVYTLT